jgi:hypothetical protein
MVESVDCQHSITLDLTSFYRSYACYKIQLHGNLNAKLTSGLLLARTGRAGGWKEWEEFSIHCALSSLGHGANLQLGETLDT